MSTKRRWFLAIAVIGGFLFFMFSFPTKFDVAVRGSDIWLVPGFDGSVVIDTGVPAVNQHWSGTLTLSATSADTSVTLTGSATHRQDWDETISVKSTIGGGHKTALVGIPVKFGSKATAGTTLHGTVTGEIVTPQYYNGGYTNSTSTVDKAVTVHVADQNEVTSHSTETQRWPLPSWMLWLFWIPAAAFVFTTDAVQIRLQRRLNS